MDTKIFKCDKLPFVELRYVSHVSSCEKKHTHETLTLTAVKQGLVKLFFSNKAELLRPETIAIINPYQVHHAEITQYESKGGFVLYLDKQWCEEIQRSLSKHITKFIPFNTSLISSKETYNEFITLCELLFENTFQLEKEERLIDFLTKIFHSCNILSQAMPEKIDTGNIKSAKIIKSILDKNSQNNLTLLNVASQAGFSITHCLRVFKKEYGLPIHAYILNQKVHKAKELLLTNMLVVDVAIESGFFDQSHLTKSFKQIFQLTPKQYQNGLLVDVDFVQSS